MITGKFTPEEDAVLRRECAKHLSYRAIGLIMNRSTNSVQARAQKLKCPNGRTAGNPDKKTMFGQAVVRKPVVQCNPVYQASTSVPKDMLALENGDCRFPLEGKLFCAGQAVHGVYCSFHAKACYQNGG